MSGTVSSSQINAFAGSWAPLADQAAAALGVSPAVVLGQWGLESGYGTNGGAVGNNVGGLMINGQQEMFATPQQFESAYVQTIQTNFPKAMNTGSNAGAFAAALGNGNGGMSYFGSGTTPAAYANGISGVAQTMASVVGNVTGNNLGGLVSYSPFSSNLTGTSAPAQAAAGACSGLTGLFNYSCWSSILADVAFVGIGGALLLFSVAGGMFGSGPGGTIRKVAGMAG